MWGPVDHLHELGIVGQTALLRLLVPDGARAPTATPPHPDTRG